jgi:hypothetical protein
MEGKGGMGAEEDGGSVFMWMIITVIIDGHAARFCLFCLHYEYPIAISISGSNISCPRAANPNA